MYLSSAARSLSFLLLVSAFAGCSASATPDRDLNAAGDRDLPHDLAARLCIATARQLDAAGYERDAIREYERARALMPSADVSTRLAVLYDRQGNSGAALIEYQKAIRQHPSDAMLLNDFACYYLNRDDPGRAEGLLRTALKQDSSHPRLWINLGLSLGAQRRYDESLAAFRHALNPVQADCNVGILAAQHGDREKAIALLTSCLQASPDLPQARAAMMLLEQNPPTPKKQ